MSRSWRCEIQPQVMNGEISDLPEWVQVRATQLLEKQEMLRHLIELFCGKKVVITHSDDNPIGTFSGDCVAIHSTPGTTDSFDIELDDESRFGFIPQVVTDSSIDGPLGLNIRGRRKIQVV